MGAAATEGPTTDIAATCGAKTRTGRPCKRVPGFGTDHVGYGHCKSHGGCSPSGNVHAARLHAATLALEQNVDPHEALLVAVNQASRWEYIARQKVAELDDDELAVTLVRQRDWTGGGENGTGGGSETIVDSRADLNIWVKTHQRSIRELASIAKTALDAGVEERRVRVAEQFGSQIAELMSRVFADLDLTEAQQQAAPSIVGRHLRVLEAGPAAAGPAAQTAAVESTHEIPRRSLKKQIRSAERVA